MIHLHVPAGMYKLEAGRTFADSRIVAQGVVMDSQRKVTAELFVHPTDFHNARRFANAVHARPCIPGKLLRGWWNKDGAGLCWTAHKCSMLTGGFHCPLQAACLLMKQIWTKTACGVACSGCMADLMCRLPPQHLQAAAPCTR